MAQSARYFDRLLNEDYQGTFRNSEYTVFARKEKKP
jgi:hypothetical protein